MKNKVLIGLAVVSLIASGCVTTYDTEKSTWTGDRGFSQTQLENNIWQINFTGNTHTDIETRKNYILQKAAQIAVKNSYSFFKVVQSETSEDIAQREGTAEKTSTRARGRAKRPYVHSNTFTTMTIKFLNKKEAVDGVVYDANSLLNSDLD